MSLYQALVEKSSDLTSLVSVSGEVLYASSASSRVLGYLPAELVGRNAFDLIHPEDQLSLRRPFKKVLAGPKAPPRLGARILHKNGQWRRLRITLSNLLDEPSVGAIAVNCRQGRRKTALCAQSQDRGRKPADTDVDLEHFAYALAHDLRQPLRTISMFAELLAEQYSGQEPGELLTQHIIDGVARLSAMLEGLYALAVSGSEDSPHPVNLGPVVTQALQNLGYAIAQSGAVVTVDPMPWVLSHENHLVSVFQNLIMNAIKYRSAAPCRIHLSAERLRREWIIRVQDNGVGIAPEYHDRIFLFLKRLHGAEIPGAGMGLAICRKIIRASGGRIWVESAAGAGATFCFSLASATESMMRTSIGGRKAVGRQLVRTTSAGGAD